MRYDGDEKFVLVHAWSLSLSVLQLQVAFAANGTEKATGGVAMMPRLDSRILIEIIVAIWTDCCVLVFDFFLLRQRYHVLLNI